MKNFEGNLASAKKRKTLWKNLLTAISKIKMKKKAKDDQIKKHFILEYFPMDNVAVMTGYFKFIWIKNK